MSKRTETDVETFCVECGASIGYLAAEYADQRWRCPAHARSDEPGYHEGQPQHVEDE